MIDSFAFGNNVVGIVVNSDIDGELIADIHQHILERLEENLKINLFVEIESGHKISLNAVMKDLIFAFDHGKSFQKIAMVTNLTWLKNVMEIKDLVMNAEVRAFSNEDRLDAINWITQ